ncbi:hypothetical protein ALNOE001_08790 [Candidatus Methanobinarius endosymbioticus]|uniref:Uncharacterized protein n=1 Tax=Candidatus Methanobinarius endosymbioticus TaxID=2006182 RepID=A0A366MD48_9EURY|nr:hypothetical protein ALNOE001_08790 [Candidatus Methanobinarius endosymbioticus]
MNHPNLNFAGFIPIKTWYVLQLSAEDIKTMSNTSKHYIDRYNATLKYQLSTNIPSDHDPSNLPYFILTVIGFNGERTTANIRNTIVSYFVERNGNYSIRSLSDEEDIVLTVTFPKSLNHQNILNHHQNQTII